MDDIVAQLRRLGMSGYEAKAYIALVSAGQPLNGYEVAKRSGVPRSTVYETLSKLVTRSAAFEVSGDGRSVEYLPLPPATLFGRLRDETEDAIDTLRPMFDKLGKPQGVHFTHALQSRAEILDRAQDLIASARSELALIIWPEELSDLDPTLRRAADNGVDITVVSFGEPEPDAVGRTFSHVFSSPEEALAGMGCRVLVVVADREQVVTGGLLHDAAWGVLTDDPAIAAVATMLVQFDVFVQHFVHQLDPKTVAAFRGLDDPQLAFLRGRTTLGPLVRQLADDDNDGTKANGAPARRRAPVLGVKTTLGTTARRDRSAR
jgi:sugar-specific transcriptional regulator TrmB